MKKIVIVSGLQLSDNPRVVKEADALAELGYSVEVLAAVHDARGRELAERIVRGRQWCQVAVVDFSKSTTIARLERFYLRARWRAARSIKGLLPFELPDQLGPLTRKLYRVARRKHADLYIVHLEQALWTGVRLIKAGRRVAADIEDWYSEDGLTEDRAKRPIQLMKRHEAFLLKYAAYVTTTSEALARALHRAYGGSQPTVIYNSFPTEERQAIDGEVRDRRNRSVPSLIWFSQRIGPGRGLEELIAAVSRITGHYELHIRGNARRGFTESLLANIPQVVRDNVYFHPQVPQDELLSRLAEHDIGYCGERSVCANRDLTIVNKLFEYMRAGLAIVASDTTGQSEVATQSNEAISLFRQDDATSLQSAIEAFLNDPEKLSAAKKASVLALEAHFDWSRSKARIQALAQSAFEAR